MFKNKYLIFFFIILLNYKNFVFAETSDSKKLEQSLPSFILSTVGFSISSLAIVFSVFSKPENIGIQTESFILKTETDKIIYNNLTTFWGINYKFSEIFEITPSISLNNNKITYLFDTGINLTNSKIINNEVNGLTPFISVGLTTFYNSNFSYGAYSKVGIILKLENFLYKLDSGYRFMPSNDLNTSTNSFILGGSISYRF
ncbi:MAG: hypothetical protein U0457_20605 [Candidatus Sericytochromatia bacterium]